MKTGSAFDCVRMKDSIQAELRVQWRGLQQEEVGYETGRNTQIYNSIRQFGCAQEDNRNGCESKVSIGGLASNQIDIRNYAGITKRADGH